MTTLNIPAVASWLQSWQQSVIDMLLTHETKVAPHLEAWSYPHLGGGNSQALLQGNIIEKGGVNFSHIHGESLPDSATPSRKHLVGHPFEALGVSLVIHPENPFLPTTHANLRLFVSHAPQSDEHPNWWFGGGYDLTPYYGFTDDCQLWHQKAKDACDLTDPSFHGRFKKECDDYFVLPHRKEQRGIGGLFFDDINEYDFDTCFNFIKHVGDSLTQAYNTILSRRKDHPWEDKHKAFQQMRRGRYVEFNLLYDRGTLFGLKTKGRTESILMSLPPSVAWPGESVMHIGPEEKQLTDYYLIPRDWLANPLLEEE